MLYHVPDRAQALAELRRVLRPGGRLAAATNGAGHLRELDELAGGVDRPGSRHSSRFGLENGAEQLAGRLRDVARRGLRRLRLEVTEAAPLVAYSDSMALRPRRPEAVARIERGVAETIARERQLPRDRKSQGLVRGRKP